MPIPLRFGSARPVPIYCLRNLICKTRNPRPQCNYLFCVLIFAHDDSEATQLADALNKSWKKAPYTDEGVLREIIHMLSVAEQITPFEMHQSKLLESIYL